MTLYRIDLLDDQNKQSQHQCEAESSTPLTKTGIRTISIEDVTDAVLDIPLVEGSQFGRTWPDHHPKANLQLATERTVQNSLHVFTPTATIRERIAAIEEDGRRVIEIQIREAGY